MRLSQKALVLVTLAVFCLVGTLFGFWRVIVLRSFVKLEQEHTLSNVKRALFALSKEVNALDSVTRDWGSWDDTYDFIEDRNPKYITSTLTDETFLNVKVNLVVYVNTQGEIVFEKAFGLPGGEPTSLPAGLEKYLSPGAALLAHPDPESAHAGILNLPGVTLLMASRPILTSKNEGPVRGALLMGRAVDGAVIEYLKETTFLDLSLSRCDPTVGTSDLQQAASHLSKENPYFISPLDKNLVGGYALVGDIFGNPGLILKIQEPRTIYHRGQVGLRYSLTVVVLIGLLFVALTAGLLNKTIINRLEHLSSTLADIGSRRDFSTRLAVEGNDELSRLAVTANGMLASLEASHRQLLESEELFRSITQSAQDAVIMIDDQGAVSFWNPAAEKIFGYRSEEITGKELHKYLAPSRFYEQHHQGFTHFQKTGEGPTLRQVVELEGVRKGGTEFPLELSLARLQLKGKWHSVGIIRDISERKLAAQKLQRAYEETEEVNQELEKAIARANEMAMEAELASVAKSAFLANMSHELRTPLNGVIGMAGLLLDTDLSPEQRDCADTVRRSGELLLALINDILDFSKIEAGKLELESLDFDVRSTLEEATDVLALKAEEKGLELVCDLDPEVPLLLRGDPNRLRQILLNLTGNAVKFTSAGEVSIRVNVEHRSDTHVTLRFSVTDTGIGISRKRLDKVFEPFTQADVAVTRRYGGTGLGLSISKRLAEIMGGSIGIQSTEGVGSKFWFTAVFATLQSAAGSSPDHQQLAGLRILVVDDNLTSRTMLTTLLASWGCVAHPMEEAESALEKLSRTARAAEPFDVALLDLTLPGMDGEELGRRIRQDQTLRDTSLVLLTPFSTQIAAAGAQERGFSAVLAKPVKQAQLLQCLHRLLDRSAVAADQPELISTDETPPTRPRKAEVRILLAEDNPTNQKVALGMLKKLGYRVDAVENGVEAIRSLECTHYDLVLMDCQMPKLDGYETTRRIRSPLSKVLNQDIPIIAMTASTLKGDQERCMAVGMNDFVPKPIRPQELSRVIDRQLGQNDAPAAPAEQQPSEATVFDRSCLLEWLMGDEELARTIIASFLQDAPRQITALRGALEKQDAAAARLQAHSLKGASANVGAFALKTAAHEAEKTAAAGDLAAVTRLVPVIEEHLDHLRSTLEEIGLACGATPQEEALQSS